jgi:hypothetical protein
MLQLVGLKPLFSEILGLWFIIVVLILGGGDRSPSDVAYSGHLMGRYSDEFSGSTSPSSLIQPSHYVTPGTVGNAGHYGVAQGPSGYYGGGSGSGMYFNSLQASILYPHLYSATVSPSHHLHLSGSSGLEPGVNGTLDEYGSMGATDGVTPGGEAGGHHAHHHHHHRANQADSQVYGGLEGDESQTGPIRGAYSARSEHGVWRPY